MATIKCNGLNAAVGFGFLGGSVDIGICYTDNWNWVYPRISLGVNDDLGLKVGGFSEKTTMPENASWTAPLRLENFWG